MSKTFEIIMIGVLISLSIILIITISKNFRIKNKNSEESLKNKSGEVNT
jgi:hypothetical protein